MSCCDPCSADDKEVAGVCPQCEGDINAAGETIYDICGYSPLECDVCGDQPCNLSC